MMECAESISSTESQAIKFLRALAIVFILLCHLFEAYGSGWSTLFYIGVPIFFILSGWLYGHKKLKYWRSFAFSRFLKIYIPYLTFVLPALGLFLIFHPDKITGLKVLVYVLNLQGFTGCELGLNHLWFVTAIVACYCFLPLLQFFRRYRLGAVILCWTLLVLDFVMFKGRLYWLPLFAISYYLASAGRREIRISAWAVGIVLLSQLVLWNRPFLMGALEQCNLVRSLGALAIVYVTIWRVCKKGGYNSRLLNFITLIVSFFSYGLYLVHNIWCVGPFSLSHLTGFVPFNIFLILVLSFLLSFTVLGVSWYFSKKLRQIRGYI